MPAPLRTPTEFFATAEAAGKRADQLGRKHPNRRYVIVALSETRYYLEYLEDEQP